MSTLTIILLVLLWLAVGTALWLGMCYLSGEITVCDAALTPLAAAFWPVCLVIVITIILRELLRELWAKRKPLNHVLWRRKPPEAKP